MQIFIIGIGEVYTRKFRSVIRKVNNIELILAHAQQHLLKVPARFSSVFTFSLDVTNDCILALSTFFDSGIHKMYDHEPRLSVKDFRSLAKKVEENEDIPFENHFLIAVYTLIYNTLCNGPKPVGYFIVVEQPLSSLFVPLILKVRAFEDSLRKLSLDDV